MKNPKIKPLGNRVLIKAIAAETKTASGIIIPDTASKEKPQKGEVLAVGPGKITIEGKTLPMNVKAGNTVLFSKYGPTEIKIDGEEYLIAEESDILGVIEE